jgi:hypothetical protein
MNERHGDLTPFEAVRPQLLALLALYRTAETAEAREALESLFEKAFLTTAWHVAHDLLENGWSPGFVSASDRRASTRLRLVGGSDAA